MQKPKHRQIDSTILNATYILKPPSATTIYSSMALTRPTSASSFLHPDSNTASPSQKKKNNKKKKKNTMEKSSPVLWDCDSSLYDSYELKSFKQHLDSAINSRSISMPHLPARRIPPLPAENLFPLKKSCRLSRSISRFLRSLFRRKPKRKSASEIVETEIGNVCGEGEECCDLSGYSLWTIPEVPETFGQFSPPSPELSSVSRRAVSDRFTKFSLIQHRF